jgi:intracellular septation protein
VIAMEKTDSSLPSWARILVEWGPLIAFFIANARAGIFWGTGVFMAASVVALAVSWTWTRKLALVPLIGAVFVAIFGGLTLWLQNETFIKVKVTLVNLLFGTVLLSGLAFRKQFLKLVLGEALKLDDEGWRILTLRWGLFFFALALLNEMVWRTVSTDLWVNFKVFGILPITLLFALSQAPLMSRHLIEPGSSSRS